jgi:hypothetical protein
MEDAEMTAILGPPLWVAIIDAGEPSLRTVRGSVQMPHVYLRGQLTRETNGRADKGNQTSRKREKKLKQSGRRGDAKNGKAAEERRRASGPASREDGELHLRALRAEGAGGVQLLAQRLQRVQQRAHPSGLLAELLPVVQPQQLVSCSRHFC